MGAPEWEGLEGGTLRKGASWGGGDIRHAWLGCGETFCELGESLQRGEGRAAGEKAEAVQG